MESIQFAEKDAAILYSMPQPGCSLHSVIKYYSSTNRDIPPNYEELKSCLEKSIGAGIIRLTDDGLFVVNEEWYGKMHEHDNTADYEILAMLDFEDYLCDREWPLIRDSKYELTRQDYDNTVPGD